MDKDVPNPYDKRKFTYDPERDAYQCPQGEWLPLKTITTSKDGHTYWIYQDSKVCLNCPVRDLCTKSKTGGREIRHDDMEPLREGMRRKMGIPEAKDIYRRRKCIVEPVFGQIKEAMGFRRFLFRGLEKVRNEFILGALAHNLRRVMTQLRESPQLRSILRTWTPKREADSLLGAN